MRLDTIHSLIIVAMVALATQITRWTPFLLFSGDKKLPKVVEDLGRLLPPAMMGLLVVYCLRSVSWLSVPHGAPELIAIAGRKEAGNEVRMTAIGLLRDCLGLRGDGFVEAAVLEVEAAAVVHHAADRSEAVAAEDVIVHGVVGDLQEGGTAAHGDQARHPARGRRPP